MADSRGQGPGHICGPGKPDTAHLGRLHLICSSQPTSANQRPRDRDNHGGRLSHIPFLLSVPVGPAPAGPEISEKWAMGRKGHLGIWLQVCTRCQSPGKPRSVTFLAWQLLGTQREQGQLQEGQDHAAHRSSSLSGLPLVPKLTKYIRTAGSTW